MNSWDLTKNLLQVMADIDRAIEEKTKTSSMDKWLILDAEIERLENIMFELIRKLKNIPINEE